MGLPSFGLGLGVGLLYNFRKVFFGRGSGTQQELLTAPSNQATFLAQKQDYKSVVSDLELGSMLGRGSYGRVFEAKWRGALVAVKILDHQHIGFASNAAVSMEAMISVATVHPNVVPVYEVFSQDGEDEDAAAYSQQTFILMERADRGSLQSQGQRLSEEYRSSPERGLLKILRCLLDVIFALEYLHGIGVTHGDLKPANILCKSAVRDARGYLCKVCDFGLSSISSDLEGSKVFTSTQERGGLLYAAPETLSGRSPCAATDIFSLGTLAWQLLNFQSPDTQLDDAVIMYRVLEERWSPEIEPTAPESLRRIITSCWQWDSSQRPTAREIRASVGDVLHTTLAALKQRQGAAQASALPALHVVAS